MKSAAEVFEQLGALPVSAAILDASGTILAVNDAWKDFGRQNGLRTPDFGVGASYLTFCPAALPGPSDAAGQIRDLIDGRLDLLTLVYPCDSPTEKRWFVLIGVPLSTDRPTGVALLHVNLTELFPASGAAASAPIGMIRAAQGHPTEGSDVISASVERSVAETLSSDLMEMFTAAAPPPEAAASIVARAQLSKRQLQVLRLLGEGKSNTQIAAQLFRSPHTVKLHVSAILHRLGLKSRTQAALLASRLLPRPGE